MAKTLGLLLAFLLTASPASWARSIAYAKVEACGTVAHTITIDLADPEVRVSVALARNGTGSAESFKSIVKRTRPVAAITGTFFDTKTLKPTGDIALFGKLVHYGCIGSALCIDAKNRATIVPLSHGRKKGWTGYETVLCAGPTLVADARVAIALRHEGFRNSLHSSSRRVAAGITAKGKLLLVVVNRRVSLYTVAKLMVKLGATDAVSLDGGSSTAFYHAGRYFAMPFRKLTNCLVVYATVRDYENARSALAPAERVAAKPDASLPDIVRSLKSGLLPPDADARLVPVQYRP